MKLLALTLTLLLATPLLAQTTQPLAPNKAHDSLAQLPHWPIGIRLSDDLAGERAAKNKNRRADILVWVPDTAKKIRAFMICPENTDSKHFHEHAALRKVLTKHEVGIVYMAGFHTGIEYHHAKPVETPPAAPDNVQKMLNIVAAETGIAEFKHAPFISFGKSSRGEFPFRLPWIMPERAIAGITYHGEAPTFPIPDWAKPQSEHTILYVCANGQEEWDGTWYRHGRPFLLNYRHNTAWLPHQVIGTGVGHGNYVDGHGSKGWGQPVPEGTMSVLRIWDYLTVFTDKALTLRLPANTYATDAPIKLNTIDETTGYLVHPRAIEELLGSKYMALRQKDGRYQEIKWPDEKHPVVDDKQTGPLDPKLLIRKATDVPENERKDYLWLADKELVQAWLDIMNVTKKNITIP